jgi:DNA-directed RNA polymerase alpha subunit
MDSDRRSYDGIPIEALGLGRRFNNALYRARIRTAGQLADCSVYFLYCVQGIGMVAVHRIREALAKYNLELKKETLEQAVMRHKQGHYRRRRRKKML